MAPTTNTQAAVDLEEGQIRIRNPLTGKQIETNLDDIRAYERANGTQIAEAGATIGKEGKFPRFFLLESERGSSYISARKGAEINEYLPQYDIPSAFQKDQSHLAVTKLFWKSGIGVPGEHGDPTRKAYFHHIKALEQEKQRLKNSDSGPEHQIEVKIPPLLKDVDAEPQNEEEAADQLAPQFERKAALYTLSGTAQNEAAPALEKLKNISKPAASSWIHISHDGAAYYTDTASLTKRKLRKGHKVKLGHGRKWKLEPTDEGNVVYRDHEGRVVAEEIRESTQWGVIGMVELNVKDEFEQLVGLGNTDSATDFLITVWVARIAAELGLFEGKIGE